MRRRELVAGVGSLGVLGGAGYLLRNGTPSFEDDEADEDDGSSDGPIEVETVDARGSEAGSMSVPSADATVLMFFVTGCGNCQAQVPRLADARERLGDRDDVRFLSVTYQSRDQLSPDELREWWSAHGGNGYVGYNGSGLAREYGAVGYPVMVVVDADGEGRWRETGAADSSAVVAAVESVLEDAGGGEEGDDEPPDDDASANDEPAENETDAGSEGE